MMTIKRIFRLGLPGLQKNASRVYNDFESEFIM
jgi:hypothetical protein